MSYQLNIREARQRLGWTQQRLADECDLSRWTINRLELGAHQPTLHTYARVRSVLEAATWRKLHRLHSFH